MKLKLIQSGGFAGRSKSSEVDLSLYPEQLQTSLDERLLAFQKRDIPDKKSLSRDTFQYFLEYKGVRVPIDERMFQAAEFSAILSLLKTNLHY